MNHQNISKYNMFQKMIAFFGNADFSIIWTTFTRLQNEITNFIGLNVSLLEFMQQQELDIKGQTQAKNYAYLNMITIAVNDSKKAYTWAVDNGDLNMQKLFNVTLTDLKHQAESGGYTQSKNLRDAISANIATMADVELLPADVAIFDKAITNYENLLGNKGAAKEHKKEGTKGIETIMKPMDLSLGIIDRLIESVYTDSEPNMVSEYLSNRNIEKLPTHHSGVNAHIIDNITGKNLEGATMTIGTKTVSSNISGIAEIIKTKWGIFNVTIAHGNYVSQTSTVTIVRGKITKMEVRMNIKIVPVGV